MFLDLSFGSSTEALMVAILGSFVALSMFSGINIGPKPDIVPFTGEEWLWATQGGYLDTMIAHFIRNGGL
jgi:hypothetical protein